jgi:hypothetical protein
LRWRPHGGGDGGGDDRYGIGLSEWLPGMPLVSTVVGEAEIS